MTRQATSTTREPTKSLATPIGKEPKADLDKSYQVHSAEQCTESNAVLASPIEQKGLSLPSIYPVQRRSLDSFGAR
jgi:hypothetical protein